MEINSVSEEDTIGQDESYYCINLNNVRNDIRSAHIPWKPYDVFFLNLL